jgi:hypothetical protein
MSLKPDASSPSVSTSAGNFQFSRACWSRADDDRRHHLDWPDSGMADPRIRPLYENLAATEETYPVSSARLFPEPKPPPKRRLIMRSRLQNRRQNSSFELCHAGMKFTASIGFYADGRPGEVFLSSNRIGSPIEAMARDAAIMASLAMQHGADLETIRASLTRDCDGSAATAIGAAIDIASADNGAS